MKASPFDKSFNVVEEIFNLVSYELNVPNNIDSVTRLIANENYDNHAKSGLICDALYIPEWDNRKEILSVLNDYSRWRLFNYVISREGFDKEFSEYEEESFNY